MSTALARLVFGSCFVASVLACSSAGHDAGLDDDGVDRGVDAGRDLGSVDQGRVDDAGRPVDAGGPVDAGPTDPGWTAIPDTLGCGEVASNPAAVRGPFAIADCEDEERVPCQELVPDWDPSLRFTWFDGQAQAGDAATLHSFGLRGTDETTYFLMDSTGRVLQALRFRGSRLLCDSGVFFTRTRLLIVVNQYTETPAPSRVVELQRPSMAWTRTVVFDDPFIDGVSLLRANDEVIGVQARPGNVWRVEHDGGYQLLGGVSRGEPTAQLDAVVGDSVLFSTGPGDEPLTVRRGDPSGVTTLLPSVIGAETNMVRTDGETFAWFRLGDRGARPLEWDTVELLIGRGSLDAPPSGRVVQSLEQPVPSPFTAAGDGRVIFAADDAVRLIRDDGTVELEWTDPRAEVPDPARGAVLDDDRLAVGVGRSGRLRTIRFYSLEERP